MVHLKNLKVPLLSEKVDSLKCLLCPNYCILQKGEYGRCKVRKNNGYSVIYDPIEEYTVVSIEPIEKKPFKEFLSGTLSLSLGTKSCNLSCDFCENFDISQEETSKTSYLSMSDIINILKEKGCKSICFTFNEPILYCEYITFVHYFLEHSGLNIKILLKTNAYFNSEIWSWFMSKVIDAVNIDWKGSEEQFKRITHSDYYVLEERIKEAYISKTHLEISVPLYYRDRDILEKEMNYFGFFVSGLNKNIPCHLLKVFPSYRMKNDRATTDEEIDISRNILMSYGLKNVY